MAKRVHLVVASALAFALDTSALAQVAATVPTPTVQEVRGVAPQLVAFAGSEANFQNLVSGLSQGAAVTLVTFTPDGFTQTVTFTPASAMAVSDIARTLELARQQLIARGIATPTAEQIGVTLVGGLLPIAGGNVQVPGLVAAVTPGGLRPGVAASASVGPPVTLGSANPPGNLIVDVRPTAVTQPSVSVTAPSTPALRNTSDNVRLGNTSDSPVATTPTQQSSGTTSSSAGASNGSPSPAAQMQGRR